MRERKKLRRRRELRKVKLSYVKIQLKLCLCDVAFYTKVKIPSFSLEASHLSLSFAYATLPVIRKSVYRGFLCRSDGMSSL